MIELVAATRHRGWNELVVGYALAALGLLLDLPTIGASGTSATITFAIAALIAIGILLVATGMLQLRQGLDPDQRVARRSLALQGAGLVVLLLGVFAIETSSSLAILPLTAALVVSAAALTMIGGFLLRAHRTDLEILHRAEVDRLLIGTALIFIGVGVILASQIGYYFVFSDVASTVVNVVGAALSACGCVVAGYSSFVMGRSTQARELPAEPVRPRVSAAS